MNELSKINEELNYIKSPEFKLGEFIYLGKAKPKGRTVVISVAYKIDYAIKKALQFENDHGIKLTKISKVRVGELESCDDFLITNEVINEYS